MLSPRAAGEGGRRGLDAGSCRANGRRARLRPARPPARSPAAWLQPCPPRPEGAALSRGRRLGEPGGRRRRLRSGRGRGDPSSSGHSLMGPAEEDAGGAVTSRPGWRAPRAGLLEGTAVRRPGLLESRVARVAGSGLGVPVGYERGGCSFLGRQGGPIRPQVSGVKSPDPSLPVFAECELLLSPTVCVPGAPLPPPRRICVGSRGLCVSLSLLTPLFLGA